MYDDSDNRYDGYDYQAGGQHQQPYEERPYDPAADNPFGDPVVSARMISNHNKMEHDEPTATQATTMTLMEKSQRKEQANTRKRTCFMIMMYDRPLRRSLSIHFSSERFLFFVHTPVAFFVVTAIKNEDGACFFETCSFTVSSAAVE